MILCVEDGIGFVTVLIQPRPGHLLLASPGNTNGSAGSVPGDVDIVTAPGAGRRTRTCRHVPRLPCLDLRLRGIGKLDSQAYPDVGEDRLAHLLVVHEVHL